MKRVEGPVNLDEALARVLGAVRALPDEPVRLPDARGRTLAVDVRTPGPIPSFDHSAMDGFALRSADVRRASARAPRALRIAAGAALAGAPLRGRLPAGSAARIMTGARIPEGADAVVPFERVETSDETAAGRAGRSPATARGAATRRAAGADSTVMAPSVRIPFPTKPFENIRRAGEEFPAGGTVLARGARVGAAETGLLASIGALAPRCARAPQIAILSSGDELVYPVHRPKRHEIRDANGWALLAAAREAGVVVGYTGVERDDARAIARRLSTEIEEDADLLVLSGGAARTGDRDCAREALALLGARPLFTEVALKPGKALGAYVLGRGKGKGRLVFSLPGNPVSALVGFWALVRPALLALQRRTEVRLPEVRVPLPWAHEERPGRVNLLRARLAPAPAPGAGYVVAERLPEGSAMLGALARANALLRLEGTVRKGAAVRAMLLPVVS